MELSHDHQGWEDRLWNTEEKVGIHGKKIRKNSDLVYSRCLIIANDRKWMKYNLQQT